MPISEYVEYLQLVRMKPDSILRKERFLRFWFETLMMPVDAPYTSIQIRLLKETKDLGPKSFNDRLSHLNQFYTYLIGTQTYKGTNPCLFITRLRVPKNIKRNLTDEEVIQIINCPRLPKSPLQDFETYTLMFKLFAAIGARCSEVTHLKLKDTRVFPDNSFVIFRDTKSGDDNDVPIPNQLGFDILEHAKKYKFKEFTFENRYGRKISEDAVQGALHRRMIFLGIIEPNEKGINTHNLRHSRATRLTDNHADLYVTSKLMSHKDVRTTMRYIHTSMKTKSQQAKLDPIYEMMD